MLGFSIGIPAYNESANIRVLLESLLGQKCTHARLEQILVISDGSSDDTVAQARSVVDSRIVVIDGSDQKGQAARQNQIFESCTSDVVVLLNADILPSSRTFLDEVLRPFIDHPVTDLVGAQVVPVIQGNSSVSRVLNWNTRWKTGLFERINGGDSIFLCHGRARAFSRRLYTALRWPSVTGEDAYSYIFAKTHGFVFRYAPKAQVWYALPQTFQDHLSQSERFLYTVREINGIEESSAAHNWYHIPAGLLGLALLRGFVIHPIYFTCYTCMFCWVVFLGFFNRQTKRGPAWQPSRSTKRVHVE